MKTIIVDSKKHGIREILVDDEDYDLVKGYTWRIVKGGKSFYAATQNPRQGARQETTVMMHRLLLGLTKGDKRLGDHIDHCGMNNQRSNLRIATSQQNSRNRSSRNGSSSKYLGVSWDRIKWTAQIGSIRLGRFKDEIDAAKAYDAAAKIHHGEFANLNFKEDK